MSIEEARGLKKGDEIFVIEYKDDYSPIKIIKECNVINVAETHILYKKPNRLIEDYVSFQGAFLSYEEALKKVISMEGGRLKQVIDIFSKLENSYYKHIKEQQNDI